MSTGTEVATLAQKKDQIEKALVQRAEVLKELLPPDAVDQAPRLIRVAMLYFTRSPMLQEATPISFIQCAFDSVAAGIPLDGKLGHAVVFNQKVKTPQGDKWEKQVKFMPDFKGLVSVARRTGQITDAQTGVVYQNDAFDFGRRGPQMVCDHTPAMGDRGEFKGVYCILTFPSGDWTAEWMPKDEIDKVRKSSKASESGPWVDWFEQMARKTVLKRTLKTYCDDPQLLEAFRADDSWHDHQGERPSRVQASTITTLKKVEGAAAIAHAVAEQEAVRSLPAPENKVPSKPRSQRKTEETEQAPPVDDAPPPEAFDEAQGEEPPPLTEDELFNAYSDQINEAKNNRTKLTDVKAAIANDKSLPDPMKLTLTQAIAKRLQKPAQGELLGGQ
jgi:recombination protein RecT